MGGHPAHRNRDRHKHTYKHTHTLRTAKREQSKERRLEKLLRSCRAVQDVFWSGKEGTAHSAMLCRRNILHQISKNPRRTRAHTHALCYDKNSYSRTDTPRWAGLTRMKPVAKESSRCTFAGHLCLRVLSLVLKFRTTWVFMQALYALLHMLQIALLRMSKSLPIAHQHRGCRQQPAMHTQWQNIPRFLVHAQKMHKYTLLHIHGNPHGVFWKISVARKRGNPPPFRSGQF